MYELIIFGTGVGSERAEKILKNDTCRVTCYLDNKAERWGKKYHGKKICAPAVITELTYDFVIVTTIYYEEIVQQLQKYGVGKEKIISYYSDAFREWKELDEFLKIDLWRANAVKQLMEAKLNAVQEKFRNQIRNLEYEVADKIRRNRYQFLQFADDEECINKIINEGCSLCRFGDGEFEIMRNHERARFQKTSKTLGYRLKDVLESRDSRILIAVANNYGSLEKYTQEAADGIRLYMTPEVRKFHEECLDYNRKYYDAYITRPYIHYRDKEDAVRRFAMLSQIWEGRDVIVIEGEYTRMGVGNNLFEKAHSVHRILAPSVNAWDKYETILEEASRLEKQFLFLISLGPAATVLAYDLAKAGYQAVDIGHLDNEYEWFIRKAEKKIDIPEKYVNEVSGGDYVTPMSDQTYQKSVISHCL